MRSFLSALSIVGCCAFASSAQAIVITEAGDFGDTLGSEFLLPGGVTQVTGTNFGAQDGDLLRFVLGTSQSVTFDLDFITGDANLLLFNGAGNPIEGDDDGGPGIDSRITISLTAGEYLLGIGRNNIAGFDINGVAIVDNDSGLCTSDFFCQPSGVLHSVGNELDGAGGDPHDWVLTFSVPTSGPAVEVQVPEPATLALFGFGLAGLTLARRRKTARQLGNS